MNIDEIDIKKHYRIKIFDTDIKLSGLQIRILYMLSQKRLPLGSTYMRNRLGISRQRLHYNLKKLEEYNMVKIHHYALGNTIQITNFGRLVLDKYKHKIFVKRVKKILPLPPGLGGGGFGLVFDLMGRGRGYLWGEVGGRLGLGVLRGVLGGFKRWVVYEKRGVFHVDVVGRFLDLEEVESVGGVYYRLMFRKLLLVLFSVAKGLGMGFGEVRDLWRVAPVVEGDLRVRL